MCDKPVSHVAPVKELFYSEEHYYHILFNGMPITICSQACRDRFFLTPAIAKPTAYDLRYDFNNNSPHEIDIYEKLRALGFTIL